MREQWIDRALASDQELAPSSGFADAVMERVRSERAQLPPLAFPWKRAGAAVLALALIAVTLSASFSAWGGPAITSAFHGRQFLPAASGSVIGWLAASLAVALASMFLSMRAAFPRS